MAAFAGALTLGSCKDDDDDVKPAPAPEPEVIDTVPFIPAENYFAVNGDSLFSGDTIKANTLLNKGVNSDSLTLDVVLRNETVIDSSSLSFSFSNNYLGKVNVQGVAKFVSDSSYTVKFPAIEGNYTFSVNGIDKQFKVVGTGKELSKSARALSNMFTMKYSKDVDTNLGIKFVPYNVAEDTGARFTSAAGSFIAISAEDYDSFVNTTSLGTITDFIEDATLTEGKLMLKNVEYFIYSNGGKNYVVKIIDFAGSNVDTTDLTMVVTY